METNNEKLQELSRTAAMTFVLARAFNLWNNRLESQARKLKQCHTRETRLALSTIEDGAKKISFGLRHFEDWALNAGETESGHCGDFEAMEAYLIDGAWLAYLAGATFNAAKYDNSIRLTIESLCKNKTTSEPLIDWSVLEEMRPKI